jgi:hypothetical protein
VRQDLGLAVTDRKTIMVMGGGEGNGAMTNIVDAMYVEFVSQGIDALILVVCGRNEELKEQLETRDWREVFNRWNAVKERSGQLSSIMSYDVCGEGMMATTGCIETGTVTNSLRRMLSKGSLLGNAVSAPFPMNVEKENVQESVYEEKKGEEFEHDINSLVESSSSMQVATPTATTLEGKSPGNVKVVGLGFIEEMAKFMVATDVLVSKAGPGTISEAAALSLPVLLTSYLPGQEEGNIDFVIDAGFGAFCSDSDPTAIAEELCMWLQDEKKLETLSKAANAKGAPYAARDIVKVIGDSSLKWKDLNAIGTNPEALQGKGKK